MLLGEWNARYETGAAGDDETRARGGADRLVRRLARSIRTWRPSVVILPARDPAAGPTGPAALVRAAGEAALILAADPTRLTGWDRLGLRPWRVTRVLERRPDGEPAAVTVRAADPLRTLGGATGDLAASALSRVSVSAGPDRRGVPAARPHRLRPAGDRGSGVRRGASGRRGRRPAGGSAAGRSAGSGGDAAAPVAVRGGGSGGGGGGVQPARPAGPHRESAAPDRRRAPVTGRRGPRPARPPAVRRRRTRRRGGRADRTGRTLPHEARRPRRAAGPDAAVVRNGTVLPPPRRDRRADGDDRAGRRRHRRRRPRRGAAGPDGGRQRGPRRRPADRGASSASWRACCGSGRCWNARPRVCSSRNPCSARWRRPGVSWDGPRRRPPRRPRCWRTTGRMRNCPADSPPARRDWTGRSPTTAGGTRRPPR